MMRLFCETFKKPEEILTDNLLKTSREKKVVDGRMDVCASSGDQKIIIENKINSGLNGVKRDQTAQLTTYYNWGKEHTSIDPLCFLTFPDIYEDKILKDIRLHDPQMENIFNRVTYGQIAEFLSDHKQDIPSSYEYIDYIDDIIQAFKNLSYKTKENYYAQKFYQATLD